MPVRKYRCVEDLPLEPRRKPLDPANLELAFELSATAARLARRRVRPGVHRYRSTAEAREQRDAWDRTKFFHDT